MKKEARVNSIKTIDSGEQSTRGPINTSVGASGSWPRKLLRKQTINRTKPGSKLKRITQ